MIKKLRKIYEALADEQSRDIFKHRLLYSTTDAKAHIRSMVAEEINRYGWDDAMFCLIEWVKNQNQEIIVFGAGFAGGQIVETLTDFNVNVAYLADNNESLWAKERYGKKILNLDELASMKEAAIVIGINNGAKLVHRQMMDMGIPRNQIYISQRPWWLGKDLQYFDALLPHSKKEIFVDAGAFDGMDSKHFATWCQGHYEKIYAFEPDANNCRRVKKNLSDSENVFIFEKGVWCENGTLRFQSDVRENCAMSENGNIEVGVVALDEEMVDVPVTFIKMDVEGSELQALNGARRLISKNRPKLAICVYHKPEDIIEIPLKILSFHPDYKLYLRHYSYTDTETVLYAV